MDHNSSSYQAAGFSKKYDKKPKLWWCDILLLFFSYVFVKCIDPSFTYSWVSVDI